MASPPNDPIYPVPDANEPKEYKSAPRHRLRVADILFGGIWAKSIWIKSERGETKG